MGILLKCVSGAAKNVKISNFSLMFIGYVSFYCISVQIMQFPVLGFELDQYGFEPFEFLSSAIASTATLVWYASVSLSVCLSVSQSVCLCLFICLFICLWFWALHFILCRRFILWCELLYPTPVSLPPWYKWYLPPPSPLPLPSHFKWIPSAPINNRKWSAVC